MTIIVYGVLPSMSVGVLRVHTRFLWFKVWPFAFVRDMLACSPPAVAMFLATAPMAAVYDDQGELDKRTGLTFLQAEIRRLSGLDQTTRPVQMAKKLLNELRNFAAHDDESVFALLEAITAFMEKYIPDVPAIVAAQAPRKLAPEEAEATFEEAVSIVEARTGLIMPLSMEYLQGTLHFVTPDTWRRPSPEDFQDAAKFQQHRDVLLQSERS